MNDKALNLLGLAYRARMIVTGEEIVLQSMRKNRLHLVILSEDASDNTKKKITDKASHYGVPLLIKGERHILGQAIGKSERVVLGVEENGFAKKLQSLLE
ncbi:YlxQ family RNA-binding protein [Alteribacter aurantiacus]|uniref:YlxQ family RNA-binding protein n=1 Tax=Alteribacter aurantiacus TaxID=254410 RepID=UPI00041CBD4E|nr:YlxQ family RNA-binding protein [Alteribacter aurantiacus]